MNFSSRVTSAEDWIGRDEDGVDGHEKLWTDLERLMERRGTVPYSSLQEKEKKLWMWYGLTLMVNVARKDWLWGRVRNRRSRTFQNSSYASDESLALMVIKARGIDYAKLYHANKRRSTSPATMTQPEASSSEEEGGESKKRRTHRGGRPARTDLNSAKHQGLSQLVNLFKVITLDVKKWRQREVIGQLDWYMDLQAAEIRTGKTQKGALVASLGVKTTSRNEFETMDLPVEWDAPLLDEAEGNYWDGGPEEGANVLVSLRTQKNSQNPVVHNGEWSSV